MLRYADATKRLIPTKHDITKRSLTYETLALRYVALPNT